MGAFNQLNGAIFDAGAIEARLSAIDGKSIYNQRDGGILDMDLLARRLTALDGKIAVMQGGIEFDVDNFMRRLAAIEAGTFTPLQLYVGGGLGGWWDPSDFSTMWQDSAGTTPVTAIGQPVGKILDKSGNGNHLTQATTTSRPTVQPDASGFLHLLFDGVDDYLSGTSWAGFAQSTIALAANNLSALDGAYHAGLSIPNQTVYLNEAGTNTWGGFNGSPITSIYAVNLNRVLIEANRAFNDTDLYTDANPKETKNSGTAGYDVRGLFMGAAAVGLQFSNCRIYQALALNRVATSLEIASTQTYFGRRMGITL